MAAPKVYLLPAEPLRVHLRRHERIHGSIREMSEHMAGRLGCSFVTVNRHVFKALQNDMIDDRLADKLAIGLGMMPENIWGDEFFGPEQELLYEEVAV